MNIAKTNYSAYTRLPLKELAKTGSANNELVVTTPHKGDVLIPTVEGWLFQTEKDGNTVASEIRTLEWESMNYLFDKWLQANDKEV
jgi:hypothetical protein